MTTRPRPKALRVDTAGGTPELYLYGEISQPAWYLDGEDVISAQAVVDVLTQYSGAPEIVARINSPGGDVFEGVAIYQALSRFPGRVRVEIDALAASAASLVAMAGDEIVMAGNAMMMIHRAWTIVAGNALELAKMARVLEQLDQDVIVSTYSARVGEKSTRDEITSWLDAETWMSATEAVDRGFADRAGDLKVKAEPAAVAQGRYRNTPRHLLASGDVGHGGFDRRSSAELALVGRKIAARRRTFTTRTS